jgi:hypothetical protein
MNLILGIIAGVSLVLLVISLVNRIIELRKHPRI